MAEHTIAKGDLGAHNVTLTANTVEVVAFSEDLDEITIVALDGTAAVYITVDGRTPTVGGAATRVMPAAIGTMTLKDRITGPSVVKLISSGTPKVSVQRGL